MGSILRISEAASLALHTMVVLAADPEKQRPTREIAAELEGSEFHLAKILQRLSRAGFVSAVRGPKGGFLIRKPADSITLMDIYEAIEGPFEPDTCLAAVPICKGGQCMLGDLLGSINDQVKAYFSRTRLSDLV
jgi:Rrf2 family protein